VVHKYENANKTINSHYQYYRFNCFHPAFRISICPEQKTINTTLDQELKKAEHTITQSANQVSKCTAKLKQTQTSNTP
jgi:hypothetical protein